MCFVLVYTGHLGLVQVCECLIQVRNLNFLLIIVNLKKNSEILVKVVTNQMPNKLLFLFNELAMMICSKYSKQE